MTDDDTPLAVPVSEAARRIGIGRRRAYELVKSGHLRTLPIPGDIMVTVESIDALAERARQGQAEKKPA